MGSQAGDKRIGLYNRKYKRFIMHRKGSTLSVHPKNSLTDLGIMPSHWLREKFTVTILSDLLPIGATVKFTVNWGSTRHLRMDAKTLKMGEQAQQSAATLFTVVNAGKGDVALWNPATKRFVKMTSSNHLVATATRSSSTLPMDWDDAKFAVVETSSNRVLGKETRFVSLFNRKHKRVVQIDGTGAAGAGPFLPDNHAGVRHFHQDCWHQCHRKGGTCSHCGTGACCRKGWSSEITKGCDPKMATHNKHVCQYAAADPLQRLMVTVVSKGSAGFHETLGTFQKKKLKFMCAVQQSDDFHIGKGRGYITVVKTQNLHNKNVLLPTNPWLKLDVGHVKLEVDSLGKPQQKESISGCKEK